LTRDRRARGSWRRALAGLVLLGASLAASAQEVRIPNFWDPRARAERPDLTGLRTIRFLTDDEFPPLHFAAPDGAPTGFSVELARAACDRLGISCTIQARRFETLLDALRDRNGDVVAAAIPITAELRGRFSTTLPYFRIPARFAVRRDRPSSDPVWQGRTVAVVSDTAHEAYARAFMPAADLKSYPDLVSAETALRQGEVEALFADGMSLALWIGGTDSADCCAFAGGPYLESRFFGEGIGFVFRPEDDNLRRAFDFALQRLWDEGKFAELYLRFFPMSPF
jgi:polar amino acid transport system substrate-binding protein